MNVRILFPSTESARMHGAQLLQSGQYDLSFYCPTPSALECANNIIFELHILGKGGFFKYMIYFDIDQ